MDLIPFNRPYRSSRELEYVNQAMEGRHLSGDGRFTLRCHEQLESELERANVLLTTSGTHALELSALLLDLQPGDEVIVPAFTFTSTVNAFLLRGALPVFADIRPDTLNIDEAQIESLVTPKTRAIYVVHYAGVACEMDPILAIGSKHGISVIEDNAHGLFGRYRNRPLGTFGALGALSFHETKNVSCGEGGALIVNDREFLDRAQFLREKGTNRSQFFQGVVDKYTWIDMGSSFLPSDILAALLCAQLEDANVIQSKRAAVWKRYHDALRPLQEDGLLRLPIIPAHCDQSYHMFYILLKDHERREGLRRYLKEKGINSVFHYLPLNSSPMGRKLTGGRFSCPVTEDVSARLLRLPFFCDLTSDDQDRVISEILSYFGV